MGGRRQKPRSLRTGVYIVGEGITERYYFTHMRNLYGFHCVIKPRLFGNTSILAMESKVEELLKNDVFVICVFDMDVYAHDVGARDRLARFQNKFRNSSNLLLCKSFPSIEFWFLLHYEQTNRLFKDSAETEYALKKYISDYEKKGQFLEREKWVKDLCSQNKLKTAIDRANVSSSESEGSYTNIPDGLAVLFRQPRNKY